MAPGGGLEPPMTQLTAAGLAFWLPRNECLACQRSKAPEGVGGMWWTRTTVGSFRDSSPAVERTSRGRSYENRTRPDRVRTYYATFTSTTENSPCLTVLEGFSSVTISATDLALFDFALYCSPRISRGS